MASITLHVVGKSVGGFEHLKVHTSYWLWESLGIKQFMQFCMLSHWYWFVVITKSADTDYRKRISEENRWRI